MKRREVTFPNRIPQNKSKREVILNKNGKPSSVKITNYSKDGRTSVSYMNIQTYLKRMNASKRGRPSMYIPGSLSTLKRNVRPIGNSPSYELSPSPKNVAPTLSPNLTKTNIKNAIRVESKCMPQTFLYRAFRPASNKSYFNYVVSNNKNGLTNVVSEPKNMSQGIVYVGTGSEGASFMGCIDAKCEKQKVSIKASVANKPYNNSAPAREFKIHKDIFFKCKNMSPHIVMPYLMQICPQSEAFIPLTNRRMPKGLTIKPDSRVAIGYYEFYNGGDLDMWMKRHSSSLTEKMVRTMLFQVLWTMGVMYKTVPSFRHNDIHPQNILVRTDVPRQGSTKYGNMYSVPNIGLFTALGDFGWSHSKNYPNPKVMSGEYKSNYGINKNKTVRQDLHLFLIHMHDRLTKMGKFEKTRKFLEDAMGGPELTKINSNKTKFYRLLENNKNIKDIGAILKMSYFDEFRINKPKPKVVVPPKPKVKAPTPVPKKKILTNIKKNMAVTRESTVCGKRAAPKEGGVKAMSVDQMLKFIREKGSMEAKAMLMSFKGKPKRSQLCYVLTSFSAGRKLAGLEVANNNNSNNNNSGNIEVIELKRKVVPIASMTKEQLMKYIKNKGTNSAKARLNALKEPTRMQLTGIARSFAKREIPTVTKVAANRKIEYIKMKGGRKYKQPERPAISLRRKLTKGEKRLLNTVTNRIFNKMDRKNSDDYEADREKARKTAMAKMNNMRARLVASGLVNNNFKMNNMTYADKLSSPPKRLSPMKRMSPPKRMSATKPSNNKPKAYNPKTNMREYTVNTAGKFRINNILCSSYSRKQLDAIARSIGLNPKDYKNAKALCMGIMAKVTVRAHKTRKQRDAKHNAIMAEAKRLRENKENSNLKKLENARAKLRANEKKKLNEAAKKKVVGGVQLKMKPNARRDLFKRLGLM